MCGRMSVFDPQPEIERRFGSTFDPDDPDWQPRYNLAPRQNLLAVRSDEPDTMHQLNWGLIPSWVDVPDDFSLLINARGETVHEKPAFRSAFEKRRCLVPANGFFEWGGQRGSKQPYFIQRPDAELFAFAGLWERWESNGDTRETAVIITTDSNDVVDDIHDRMPVMLEEDEESTWLESDDPDELRALLDPYPDSETESYPVSKRVNSADNEDSDLVEPIDIGEQSGPDAFG